MKRLYYLISLLLLSSCLSPPPVADLAIRRSESATQWAKWQTKWSTYKLGDYPSIKDLMHSVSFAFNSNQLPRFSLSYDRVYGVSGKNDSNPAGKLRWETWDNFKEGGRPWRDPIFIDELNLKYNANLSYQSTAGVSGKYIHHFIANKSDYYFNRDKLIYSGKIKVLPLSNDNYLTYHKQSGDLFIGSKKLLSDFKDAQLSSLNRGALIKNVNRQYYVSENGKTIVKIPLSHKVYGSLRKEIYSKSGDTIFKSKFSSFHPRKLIVLKASESFHLLKLSALVVNEAGPTFTKYSPEKIATKSYPIVGKYKFNQAAFSSDSILFTFENAFTSKRLVEYSATTGKFRTIRFAAPAFFSKNFRQTIISNDVLPET